VEENARSRERLRTLVERLSDADLARDLGGGWTVSTALAHLAFWDGRQAEVLRLVAAGSGAPRPEAAEEQSEITNPAVEPLLRAIPPREAVRLALEQAEAVDRLAEELASSFAPDGSQDAVERWADAHPVRRHNHRSEHIEQIERALGR
jgi:hypothetical protein